MRSRTIDNLEYLAAMNKGVSPETLLRPYAKYRLPFGQGKQGFVLKLSNLLALHQTELTGRPKIEQTTHQTEQVFMRLLRPAIHLPQDTELLKTRKMMLNIDA